MVDIKHDEITEPTLPSKRKPVINPEIDGDAKKPKLESPEHKALHNEHATANHAAAAAAADDDNDEIDVSDKVKEKKELNDGDEDEEEEVAAAVDRKGKGIMSVDKGKGKLIEMDEASGDEDDDTSDDDDDDSEFEDDSDLSDDSLAELDPHNILPVTTRRKVFLPDCPRFNEFHANDDSDNDSSE